MTPKISVLSFGFTREMWDPAGGADTRARLAHYASHLEKYWLITNSYKRHGLSPVVDGNMTLWPTHAWSTFDSFIRMFLMGRRILKRERVDVLQAQDAILTGTVCVVLGRLFKKPVNVCIYGPNVFDPYWVGSAWYHRLIAPVGRWVLRRANSVQVDGNMTATSLRRALGPGIPVHCRPVVPSHLESLMKLERIDRPVGNPVRLVFLGRLERQKNLPLLADAFHRTFNAAASAGVAVELHIYGEGRERTLFEGLLAQGVGATAVTFHGFRPVSEIPSVYANADILVLSSFYEGYARVLMEAAAAGVPVVTTAVSGSDEGVADGRSGYITPIGDVEAFADRLVELTVDVQKREAFGAAARAHIAATLDSLEDSMRKQILIWESLAKPS
jgi:glycosyltransferase involved in cell wall biosynthesis